MGESLGFLTHHRKDPGYRPRQERLRDYKAVELQLNHQDIILQSARCMDCGTPFCHAFGCPLTSFIPELNELAYRGKWEDALSLLLTANNFPEFTGRICPAPCEASCVAGIHTESVTIRQIELEIIEKAYENGYLIPSPPAQRNDYRIAIVGAGPAGMAAADTLNKAGFWVTVFDNAAHPGGILRYGVPDFKLEKWVIDRRVEVMKKEGVHFELGVDVGKDISYRYLKDRFNAICLACGSRRPRDLSIPGRELKGIHYAMDFLTQQNRKIAGESIDREMSLLAKGKIVVIIGGGDTGSDCLGTALRQGAKGVIQLEILPKPPFERSASTPWPMWPLMLRRSHAHREGGESHWSILVQAFLGKNGVVKKVRCAEAEWPESVGRKGLRPKKKDGSEFEVDADLVLLAMGFIGPKKGRLIEALNLEWDDEAKLKTNSFHMTHIPGLFVAGDMAQGQSIVASAMMDARKTSAHIQAYLGQ